MNLSDYILALCESGVDARIQNAITLCLLKGKSIDDQETSWIVRRPKHLEESYQHQVGYLWEMLGLAKNKGWLANLDWDPNQQAILMSLSLPEGVP